MWATRLAGHTDGVYHIDPTFANVRQMWASHPPATRVEHPTYGLLVPTACEK